MCNGLHTRSGKAGWQDGGHSCLWMSHLYQSDPGHSGFPWLLSLARLQKACLDLVTHLHIPRNKFCKFSNRRVTSSLSTATTDENRAPHWEEVRVREKSKMFMAYRLWLVLVFHQTVKHFSCCAFQLQLNWSGWKHF